eukprot:7060672-Ditylum_brightwellii.AAC.1
MQNGMAEEKRMARKAIVTLLTKCNLVTAAQKQEMSITEKCSDTEKCMALFAEKIGVWNMQSCKEVWEYTIAQEYMHTEE